MRATVLLSLLGLAGCWPRIPGQYSDYEDGDTDTDTDTSGPLTCPADDVYEDNDEEFLATDISVPVSLDAIACTNDFDYYAFDVGSGCLLDVLVTFSHAAGDVDVQLLEGTTPVAAGQSTDDDEVLTWFAEASGPYKAVVYGYDGAQNTYTLDIDVDCN